jgi:hypothetical protein
LPSERKLPCVQSADAFEDAITIGSTNAIAGLKNAQGREDAGIVRNKDSYERISCASSAASVA